MKKTYFIKSLLLASAVFLGACSEKILDYKDPSNYNADSYYNTPAQIEGAVNGAYVSYQYFSMLGWKWPEMFDVLGNESKPTSSALSAEPSIIAFEKYQINNLNDNVLLFWRGLYKRIQRANLVILKGEQYESIHGVGKDPIVSRSIGQAYFIRGHAYFELAFYYGRVPLRLSFNQVGIEDAPRADKIEDVWTVAESDFKKAQELLPESYDNANLGRATKGSATGFLGKLYLYTKKYAESETELAKLEGKYSLLPKSKWDDNFGETNENNQESVFEYQFAWKDGNFPWGNFGANPDGDDPNPSTQNAHAQLYTSSNVGGWNNWKFQDYRINDFKYKDEAGIDYIDPRAELTFYGSKTTLGDTTILDKSPDGKQSYDFASLGYWFRKYTNLEVAKPNFLQSGVNHRFMRYADVLLMRAENKLETADLTAAIGFINQVRERIGAFKYTLGKYTSKTEVFNLLKRERLIELMGEQSRYNDLKRWGILEETINPELQFLYGVQNVTSKHYYFPIPQLEIDTNLKLGDVSDVY